MQLLLSDLSAQHLLRQTLNAASLSQRMVFKERGDSVLGDLYQGDQVQGQQPSCAP